MISPLYRKLTVSSDLCRSRTSDRPEGSKAPRTETRFAVVRVYTYIYSLPQAMILPSRIIAALLQKHWTSERIWEDKNTVIPFLFLSFNISKNSRCISGSSPPVGSSRIQSLGLCCRAQMTASFFRFPKESSLIRREGSNCRRSHSSSDVFRQSFRCRSAEKRIRSRPRISG